MSGAYHPNVALGFISYRAYRSRNATAGPGWRIQGRDTNDTIRGPRETSTIQTHPKMRFGEILVKVHAARRSFNQEDKDQGRAGETLQKSRSGKAAIPFA
jgi:hypothetical protein